MWLTVGCKLPTSVRLSWGCVPWGQQNGEITGYGMQVEGPDTTQIEYIKYKEHKELHVMPSTEYTFSISAVTVAGSGPAISVSFVTPQEGETLIRTWFISASTLMECACLISIIIPVSMHVHTHTQLSPTLLVGLKPANIIQHQHRFSGKIHGRKLSLATQYK